MEKRVVIIGAGYAGILTAKKLAKRFKKDHDVSITIIDKNPFHTMLTELHEVAANRVEEDSIKISLKKVFTGRNVSIKLDNIKEINFEKKIIVGDNENYQYDFLVIAAGSKPTFFGIPGAQEYSYKLWSYEDAVILKDHIHEAFRKAVSEKNPVEKKKLLTFYVVGAGFTGVEMVGELAEYIPILCEQFEIDRDFITMYNVDVLSRTIPTLPEHLSAKVERRLARMGVNVKLNTSVVGIGKDYIETEFDHKKTKDFTSTVIWAAGIESSEIAEKAASILPAEKRGRIKVDPYLRSLNDANVFIAGDNMFYIPEGEEQPVPQTVENCEQSADVVANNIACSITGEGKMDAYRPAFHGIMVSVGGRYGVARVGTPKHMFNLPSFLAMFTKHFINIIYFIQILGWNKVISYMKHEFFTIRNCRSFVGGHFSNRTPSFLLVPLRVWLGIIWLFEGVMKVVDGWLREPKLTDFFGSANAWYNSILQGNGTGTTISSVTTHQAIDAATSATGAGQEVAKAIGTVLFHFDFLGLIQVIFVSGKDLVQSTLNDYAFRLNIPLMNWFMNTFILSNHNVQIAMQAFIVISEILVGLALIGGLFTTPASAFSLVLQAMFVTTTGIYLSTFWMIFAAIAVLIGSGKTFGLDYYVMPYIKRNWRKIPLIRKWYLYND